jgi:hypothetical protein
VRHARLRDYQDFAGLQNKKMTADSVLLKTSAF